MLVSGRVVLNELPSGSRGFAHKEFLSFVSKIDSQIAQILHVVCVYISPHTCIKKYIYIFFHLYNYIYIYFCIRLSMIKVGRLLFPYPFQKSASELPPWTIFRQVERLLSKRERSRSKSKKATKRGSRRL